MHAYSSSDSDAARKGYCFILCNKSDFPTNDKLTIVVPAFIRRMLTSRSVDKELLLRYVNFICLQTFFVHAFKIVEDS